MIERGVTSLRTKASLEADFRRLGVRCGDTLMVHASLRSLGWVVGGEAAVVQALLEVLGDSGTLVVPTQTAFNRDPSRWNDPRVPESQWPIIRDHLPAYDPAVTPSRGMGRIAEQVRTWPGARRSAHPQTSFAAIGANAAYVVDDHRLDSPLGEHSPLARLEDLDARVLLLGVDMHRCTCFHRAEYRLGTAPVMTNWCAVLGPSGRAWVSYDGITLDDSDFGQLGKAFETEIAGAVRTGPIGASTSRLFSVRAATAFAESWMLTNRSGTISSADTRHSSGSDPG